MLRSLGSKQKCLWRLCDKGEAVEVVESGGGGAADTQGGRGSDYVKPNAAASETTASDCRARGGGVIDTLAEANKSVLAANGGGGRGTWR